MKRKQLITHDQVVVKHGQPYLYVSEAEERRLIASVANDVLQSRYDPDGVVAITKGGAWGMHLAALLQLPYGCLATEHYTDQPDMLSKKMNRGVGVAADITTTSDLLQRLRIGKPVKLIIADDLADQGHTFNEVEFKLRKKYGQSFEIRYAALWRKEGASCRVDFVGKVIRLHRPTGKTIWIITQEDQRYNDIGSRLNPKLLKAFLRRKKRKH